MLIGYFVSGVRVLFHHLRHRRHVIYVLSRNVLWLLLGEFKKLQTHLLWKPYNYMAEMSYVRNA